MVKALPADARKKGVVIPRRESAIMPLRIRHFADEVIRSIPSFNVRL